MMFESGRPGSNPEWGLIYYKDFDHCTGLTRACHSSGVVHVGTRESFEHKGCNWGMQIDLDSCNLDLCSSATPSVA